MEMARTRFDRPAFSAGVGMQMWALAELEAFPDLWNPARQGLAVRRNVAVMPSVCECGRELEVNEIQVTGDGPSVRFLSAWCPPCNLLWSESASLTRSPL